MVKYECLHCGNTDTKEFRNTSDCGICTYKGKRYFYFEHLCKCSFPMYVLSNSSFTERFQAAEDEFTIIRARRDKVAATEYNDED